MDFTKVQISEIIPMHAQKNVIHDMIEGKMVAERSEVLSETQCNKSNFNFAPSSQSQQTLDSHKVTLPNAPSMRDLRKYRDRFKSHV